MAGALRSVTSFPLAVREGDVANVMGRMPGSLSYLERSQSARLNWVISRARHQDFGENSPS